MGLIIGLVLSFTITYMLFNYMQKRANGGTNFKPDGGALGDRFRRRDESLVYREPKKDPEPNYFGFDLCDSCNAAPKVRYRSETSELLFCGHHANKNEEGLLNSGFRIIHDIRIKR